MSVSIKHGVVSVAHYHKVVKLHFQLDIAQKSCALLSPTFLQHYDAAMQVTENMHMRLPFSPHFTNPAFVCVTVAL